MQEKNKNITPGKAKRFFTFRAISAKIFLCCLINCIILIIVISLVLSGTINSTTEEYTLASVKSDLYHIEDIITNHESAHWYIGEDGALYCNNVRIGDGLEDDAYLSPFEEAEYKTGSFCYAFMKVNGENDPDNGFYVRVAGTVLDENGDSLVGTFMDSDIAATLDEEGEYHDVHGSGQDETLRYYRALYNSDGEIVGALLVGKNMAALNNIANNSSRSMYAVIIIVIILTALFMFLITKKWTRSVDKTIVYLKRIGDGELPEDPLVLNTRDEIGEVASAVNEMVRSLKENRRLGAELEVAKDLQANLLPKTFPPFPSRTDFDLYASMHPAREVGGDFYDFFMTHDNKLVLIIADVSGKGIPAALFMVITRTLIKEHAKTGMPANDVLTLTNNILCEGNSSGLFVTAWLGIIDLDNGDVEFANAGHNPPIIEHNDNFSYLKCTADFVLAGMDGTIYHNQHLHLDSGDILYLYTDGVTEACNTEFRQYGEKRLINFISEKHGGLDMQELCIDIKADVDSFSAGTEQFDDMTMLAVKFTGGGSASYEKTLPATIANIEVLIDFINEKLLKHNFSKPVITQINVAVDEILSNIANYAYSGIEGTVRVVLQFPADSDQVIMKFIDGGLPYNPLEKEDPDITLGVEDRPIGGLGIYIVKKTMDNVEYTYDNGKNILTLTKSI